MTDTSDAQISERLLERDEGTLRHVVAAHGAAVHGMARRVVVDAMLAQEVVQDTFLALWRRPGSFDPQRGPLRTFLLGVARNKAVDLVRKEESLRRTKEALAMEADASLSNPETAGEMVAAEERATIKQALQGLPPLQREAIVLAYFGGRTYREVAGELGIPEGTAKTRLRDGLLNLRKQLSTHDRSD